MDPPHGSCHIPIIEDPKLIKQMLFELNMEDFFEWWFNHMTPAQKNSGGHTSAWYFEKLKKMASEYNFKISLREFRESLIIPKYLQFLFVPDRYHRGFMSLRVKLIKI